LEYDFNKSNLITYTLIRYFFLFVTWQSIPLISFSQEIVFSDHVYEEYRDFIKTIRLFPLSNSPDQELLPSVISLHSPEPLLLEFDDLYAEHERYMVKFIHCNANWTQSRLFPLDYLEEYNEFTINDYDFSFNTVVPYVHYTFPIPKFKVSGNYLLVVYKESEDNLVFTKRLMVYNQRFSMKENLEMSGLSRIGRMTQEIQFTL